MENRESPQDETIQSPELTSFVESVYQEGTTSQSRITVTVDEADRNILRTDQDKDFFIDMTKKGKRNIITNFGHGNEPYSYS